MLTNFSRVFLPPLILIGGLTAYRFIVIVPPGPAIVLLRNEPLKIEPRYDDPRVVTDEQLAAVLARVKPPAAPANTNNFLHALRLWGPNADFRDSAIPSGPELLNYFLNDGEFRRLAGDAAPPLFYRTGDGIDVRGFDDATTNRSTSSYHADDIVATLAESGVALDTPLVLRDGQATVRDLLTTSLQRYHLERLEYEWTAIAYARYVFPQREWRNKFGEKITLDSLVDEIVGHPPHLGPCNGLHRLEALVVLAQADEKQNAISPRSKAKMHYYMKCAGELLAASQTADGYWTRNWPQGTSAAAADKASPPTLHDKLLVTGHHLEWLALAPADVQPPRENIIRAAQWLARTLVEMDDKNLLEAYGPYTHAARALCLWRGQEAFAAWQRVQGSAFGVQQ